MKFSTVSNTRFGSVNPMLAQLNHQPMIELVTVKEPVKEEPIEEVVVEIAEVYSEKPVEEMDNPINDPERKLKKKNSFRLVVDQLLLNKRKKENGWSV
jgi:hypothetical protein